MPVKNPFLAQGVFGIFVKSSGLIIDTASDIDKLLFDLVPSSLESASSKGFDHTCSVLSFGPGVGKPDWLVGPCGSPLLGGIVGSIVGASRWSNSKRTSDIDFTRLATLLLRLTASFAARHPLNSGLGRFWPRRQGKPIKVQWGGVTVSRFGRVSTRLNAAKLAANPWMSTFGG